MPLGQTNLLVCPKGIICEKIGKKICLKVLMMLYNENDTKKITHKSRPSTSPRSDLSARTKTRWWTKV